MTRRILALLAVPALAAALLAGCAVPAPECVPNPADTAGPYVEAEDLDDWDGDAPDQCVRLADGTWVTDDDEDDDVHVIKVKTTKSSAKTTKPKATRTRVTRKS